MSSRCWPICSGVARSVLVAIATLMVRLTLAISLTMNRSPGPIFSLAGKHTATTSTSASVVFTRSLSRSPSSVRGRCRPGVSTRISWASAPVHDAADDGARGLRLGAGDHHLGADQRVGQRRLAGVGAADERREAAPELTCVRCHRQPLVLRRSRPRSRSSLLPCGLARAARSGPGSTARGCRCCAAAPVAHHVVRRARQLDAPASGACGSPASGRTPPPSRSSPRPRASRSPRTIVGGGGLAARGRGQPGDVGVAGDVAGQRPSGTSAQTRTGMPGVDSMIRAIAGSAVRSPTSSSQRGVGRHREGAPWARRR